MANFAPRPDPDRPSSHGINRLPGWAILLITLGLFAAIYQFSWVLFAPWAVGWLPGPKLIGTWGGVLVAEQGARYPLLLELEPHVQRASPGRLRASNIEGHGQLCTPAGMVVPYRVIGHGDPSGRDLTLWLEYADAKLSQLNFRFDGAWEGDRLALRPSRHNPFAPDGTFVPNRPLSSDDPSDYFAPVDLRKDAVGSLPGDCNSWRAEVR